MAVIANVTTLAAGGQNINVLAGSAFEFVARPSVVRVYGTGDAAGLIRVTIQSGTDVLMEESPISRQNRFPIKPDDLIAEDVAAPGDRLKVAVRNTAAVPADFFWRVEVEEIA